MKKIVAKALYVVVLAGLIPSANAEPVLDVPLPGGYLDIDYFAGIGTNTAYIIADFGGNGGGVHGFGYRWDGVQTADNALLAIAAGGALDMTINNFGTAQEPNLFIAQLTYPPDSDLPDFNVDGRFWHYWLGQYSAANVAWSESNFGISGREFEDFGNMNGTPNEILQTLTDGGFYGFYASAGAVAPRLPIAVPEPAGVLLALAGAAMLIVRVRNRRLSKV